MISTFNTRFGGGSSGPLHSLGAFHWTFACMGVVTCFSAAIFWQLSTHEAMGDVSPEA
jgi:hypothetical protein